MAAHSIGLFAILLYILVQISTQSHISDQKLCGNKFCAVTLSLARAVSDYDGSSENPKLLTFKANDVVKITSKSAGSRKDLWGGEVSGIEGFFPKSMVKEFNVLIHNPTHVVNIEAKDKKDDDDDTDLDDDTDMDAQDIIKPATKVDEGLKANEAPQKEVEKKDEKPKEAETKEEKPAEDQQDDDKSKEAKKETDETEIDDTEDSDPTEVPVQDKKEEKSSEPAAGTQEKVTSAKPGEHAVEHTEPAAKQTGEPVELSPEIQESKDKPVETVTEKVSEKPIDTLSEKPSDKPVESLTTEKPSDKPVETLKEKLSDKPAGETKIEPETADSSGKTNDAISPPPGGQPSDVADQHIVKADDDERQAGPPGDQPEVEQPVNQIEEADHPNVTADDDKILAGLPGDQHGEPIEQPVEDNVPDGKATDAEKPNDVKLPVADDEQTPPEPPGLKVAEIKVTVQEPDAVRQPVEEVPEDQLDLKEEGNGIHMEIGSVPQKNQEIEKRHEMPTEIPTEIPSDVPTGVPEVAKSKDPGVMKGLPKLGRMRLSDVDLKELRAKYVKRRLASLGQPQVQHVGHESILLNTDQPKESEANQPTAVVTPTPVDLPAGQDSQTPVAQPSNGATPTPVETESKIEPTPTSLESAEASSKHFHYIKSDVTESPHPAATDLPDANKDQPPKDPQQPSVPGKEEIVKEEPKVAATPSLQPSQPVETESTVLSEDELRSQKLLEELERGPTESLQPSSQIETTPQQESMTKSIEPSLPHEVPVKSKRLKPTPRIVLPGQRTVIPREDKRLKVPASDETPIGTVVEKPAMTEESTQPTPTDTQPKETAASEKKPEAPHVEDKEQRDESDPATTPPQVESPTVEQLTPPVTEPTTQSETGPESSTMSTLTKTAEPLVGAIIGSLPEEWQLILEKEPIGLPPTHTVLFLLICLIFSIIVSIRCMCGGGDKAMVKLKQRLQKVEHELFVANKEKDSLAQSIQDVEDKASNSTSSLSTYEETNKRLQVDVSNLQLHKSALKQSVQKLEDEVSTLSQNLESVQTSFALKEQESIVYQNQAYELEGHTTQLEHKVQEAQALLLEKQRIAEEMEGSNAALNEEITVLQQSKQQLLVEADDWNEKVKELDGTVSCLESQTRELQDAVSFKENEIEVLKDCFMQLKVLETENENDESGGEPGNSKLQEKVAAMINVSRMNAILQQVEEDKAALQQKVVIEMESRQEMEEQVKQIKQEMEELKMNHSKAEKESTEAMTKLSVLSSYFKEKEIQMQKELGEQLTQKKAKEGQLEEYGEKTHVIEKDMSMYRSQVDDLKKEIANIERDFRTQIATNEKKAHENWLLARAAERDLKEAKAESAILRQKLTDIERRREFTGPEGLIRPLPTRGMPLPMMMNGPPPPPPGAPDGRPLSRSSGIQPSPSPHHLRDGELGSPNFDRLPPPPLDRRPFPPPDRPFPLMDRPMLPPGRLPMDRPLPPPLDRRMPPPMMDMRSPPPPDRRPPMDPSPPFDRDPDRRYPPPPERFPPDRRSPPPFRPDMMPPPRMGPGGPPPYPGPGMRGPPPPRREPFPPEPYMERQGPGRPSSIPPHERPPSLPPQDRDHYAPPPPRERQQSFV
ncbi:melanoma inhibitory activity protein 2-like [Lineus longissimus]|uniref:melanoma inhibitory activity protein 2-like n=1 Tax=Lineus longissimus TaxID=88925 RepID=UPI00315C764C